jgi:adenylate cyclase
MRQHRSGSRTGNNAACAMSHLARKRAIQFIWVALCLLALVWLRLLDPGLVSTLRGAGLDTLQRLFPRQIETPLPVRIVDIDEASLKKLGQWPWSRATLATLVDNLHQMGAATVAFDIVFPEPDRLSPRRILQNSAPGETSPLTAAFEKLPDTDQQFAAALSGRPIVAAFATSNTGADAKTLPLKSGIAQIGAPALDAPEQMRLLTMNIPEINAAASGLGGINLDLAGEQGIARQIPTLWADGERFLPSLSIEALRVAQGADTLIVNSAADTENALESLRIGDIEVPVSENGTFYVHYRPDPKDLYVSAASVIDTASIDALREKIEGHIVFVGTSAVGLLDVRTTALGETVPGVSIHAQATEQMLSGRFLYRPDWVQMLEYVFMLLGGLAIAAVGAIYRPAASFIVSAVLCATYVATNAYAFNKPGLLFDPTYPVLALVLTYLASTAFRLAVTDRDGRNMRRMFGHYVAPAVLADIERNPQNLKLGGEVREVTVMFVDIANFTPLSEKLSPEELVQTVNGLWDVCSKAILSHQGTIDKFIGDAIMAFWNAPVPVPGHQAEAARAALGIRHSVAAYNASAQVTALIATRGIPPIAVRVGLATGPACVGNMGSSERFDYSVLGETVNTAARTEAACKHAAHDILIAGILQPETRKLAVLAAGHTGMKGKSRPEPISALLGDEQERATPAFEALRREHDHLAAKLGARLSPRNLASIRQLLDEMALRHPACARYLQAMASRSEDFVPPKQMPARE